jgi:molybdopterin-guanine dinucleotide biosynthesis protein A
MKKKHQKHAKLSKPNFGFWGRNEWAIIGTPCGKIQQLAAKITEALGQKYKLSYIDADHKTADLAAENEPEKVSAFDFGAYLEYTDKIDFHRFDTKATLDRYQFRQYFNESDLILVNGNHFAAKKQIVVIDPKKEKSLAKKLNRLTDVALILMTAEATAIPNFIKDHLPNLNEIPVLKYSETTKIIDFLEKEYLKAIPPLYGLVLAGGKSQRMGRDKGQINYHGQAQRIYMADILNKFCEKTFLSVRAKEENTENYPFLIDSFTGLGPFGAITSAFRQAPNAAWLVVACDLPLLDEATLATLVHNRNPSSVATAFNSPVNEFPEPLICIWEPKSYPILMQFLTQGFSCPRKVLINSDVALLDAPNGEKLMNVNRPEEMEQALAFIKAAEK